MNDLQCLPGWVHLIRFCSVHSLEFAIESLIVVIAIYIDWLRNENHSWTSSVHWVRSRPDLDSSLRKEDLLVIFRLVFEVTLGRLDKIGIGLTLIRLHGINKPIQFVDEVLWRGFFDRRFLVVFINLAIWALSALDIRGLGIVLDNRWVAALRFENTLSLDWRLASTCATAFKDTLCLYRHLFTALLRVFTENWVLGLVDTELKLTEFHLVRV